MATISLRAIEVAKTVSGNSPQTLTFPEAASQSFKRGAFVFLSAAGKVTVIASATPGTILGVAAMDATGVTDTPILVWIANFDTIFTGNLTSSTAGTATAITDVARSYGIISVTPNWTIDKAGTRRVNVLGLDHRDQVGDTGGRVLFQVNGLYTQLLATS